VADVFLAAASGDHNRAQHLARAFRLSGIEVAWDESVAERLPGYTLEDDLASAKCLVVLWSFASLPSAWIRSVATDASQRHILAAVLLDDVRLPLGFRTTVAANLTGWEGEVESEEFQRLLKRVRRIVSSTPARRRSDQSYRLSAVLRPAEGPSQPRTPPIAPDALTHSDNLPRSDAPHPLFLCYRRSDADDAAGRLYDRLVGAFGVDRVFMDIDSVPLGIDFVDHVTEQIGQCNAVIVMIGKHWLTVKDKKRRRRLDNEDDLVRAEIRAALQQRIPVIPVLVQNAEMPHPDDLPNDIRLLIRRNGIALRHDQWREGVARLLKELDPIMGGK
jgi:hypothetical protein